MIVNDKKIDYTSHSSSCNMKEIGYVPDNGYTILNYDELLEEERDFKRNSSIKGKRMLSNTNNISNTSLSMEHRTEFARQIASFFKNKSNDHTVDEEYLKFTMFCLSLLVMPIELLEDIAVDPLFELE